MRYLYGVNPQELNDEHLIQLINEANYIREYQVQIQMEAMARVLSAVMNTNLDGG